MVDAAFRLVSGSGRNSPINNVIYRPWSVRIEKNCALGLEYGPQYSGKQHLHDLFFFIVSTKFGSRNRHVKFLDSANEGSVFYTLQLIMF